MSATNANKINRDEIEAILFNQCGQTIHSLDETWIQKINGYKNGDYGLSYYGLMLYCNGHNVHSPSTKHPRGLIFHDEGKNAIFGVGVFFRKEEPTIPCIHLVAPHGKDWVQAAEAFTTNVKSVLPEAKIFIRHLDHKNYEQLRNSDEPLIQWEDINAEHKEKWLQQAAKEDETYSHSRIDLSKTLTKEIKDGLFANIESLGNGSWATKAAQNVRSCHNFLVGTELKLTFVEYTPDDREAVLSLITGHFTRLEENKKGLGSTAADYMNIIDTNPAKAKDAGLATYVGYLENASGEKRAVSFFGFEDVSRITDKEKAYAGYATITTYDQSILEGFLPESRILDGKVVTDFKSIARGFNNMPTYAMGCFLDYLRTEKNAAIIDLGGSETEELDHGKKKIGATEVKTHWVFANGSLSALRSAGNQVAIH